MGKLVMRQDEDALSIDRAELLRSAEGDEIFVRATVEPPAEHKDCLLMEGATWFSLKDAIENGDASEFPVMRTNLWADRGLTEEFSGGDVYAVSFRESPERASGTPDPRDTPFFTFCYEAGTRNTVWYAAAHVEGTPKTQ